MGLDSVSKLAGRAAGLLAALALLLTAACSLPGPKPPVIVKQWTLEYDAPPAAGQRLDAGLKVKRFEAAMSLMGTEMVYRPEANQRGVYAYHRWRVSPADLVGDYLLRDLRAQAALDGVYSERQMQRPRFLLEGGVEEFLEVDAAGQWRASLKVSLTLLDTRKDRLPQSLLFQRQYGFSQPMPSKDPAGLAQAMSAAMAQFSQQARSDIIQAVSQALAMDKSQ
ncbi:hypothetical protein AAU61_01870 [Desulfocarbo indianensis]|nr:hypothetical protein AAU61_01870 [Desulfocarbo indianensis]